MPIYYFEPFYEVFFPSSSTVEYDVIQCSNTAWMSTQLKYSWKSQEDPHGRVLVATKISRVTSTAFTWKSTESVSVNVNVHNGKTANVTSVYGLPTMSVYEYADALIQDIKEIRSGIQIPTSYWEVTSTFPVLSGLQGRSLVNLFITEWSVINKLSACKMI